ncbi:MAG: 2Fe-2S iron-sulfur cluster-binding protein, partial [Thermodesulfobacteriota bacterium]
MQFRIKVNGKFYNVDVDPQKTLLWVLREDIGLTGTKYGCGIGVCGSCTVLLDGSATPSCMVEIESVGTKKVTTIEGLNNKIGTAARLIEDKNISGEGVELEEELVIYSIQRGLSVIQRNIERGLGQY